MRCTMTTGAVDNETRTPSAFKVPGHKAAMLPPPPLAGTTKPNLIRNVYSCADLLIAFYDVAFVVRSPVIPSVLTLQIGAGGGGGDRVLGSEGGKGKDWVGWGCEVTWR